MKPQIFLRIAGVLQILLALVHLVLPTMFHWQEELARLSLLNRQIFLVHTFFIMLILVLFGVLSIGAADDLMQPGRLQRWVLGGLFTFWTLRLVCQFFVYDSAIWKGNTFLTIGHIGFCCLWFFLVGTYGFALRENRRGALVQQRAL